ncbi:MAG: ParA family protein [Deltaproteobacteria bacterium]|nr:ParA family protein [Deltaproteobacteria bacterium]
MAVICFASLKGGVGKTSISVNVSHAFAKRGCRTILIDCDPSGHSTSFFRTAVGSPKNQATGEVMAGAEAPLAQLFLSKSFRQQLSSGETASDELMEVLEPGRGIVDSIRPDLDLLRSGPELRHFLWGPGAKAFANLFPQLIRELRSEYDHVVIDTPPDFNVLTRNAIANADIVVVPVDPSEMSINSLEEIVASAQHIKGPVWVIVRSMVNKQASRVNKLTAARLDKNLVVSNLEMEGDVPVDDEDIRNFSSAEDFISILRERETHCPKKASIGDSSAHDGPIYLLNSVIFRSEQQNRLTFLGQTAFDLKATAKLAQQYYEVAREIEDIISYAAFSESEKLGHLGFEEELSFSSHRKSC